MIVTHAPKKVRHAARQSVADVIRSNLLLCIAISFEPIPQISFSSSRLLPFANAMIIQGSQVELFFKDETRAQHDLFPGSLLNMSIKTLSGMTRWLSTAGNNPGVLQSPPVSVGNPQSDPL
jgi:hypothetical protein